MASALGEKVPFVAAVTTYFGYALLMCFGYIRDFFGHIFKPEKYKAPKGYAPLLRDFEHFYTRRLYHRIQDCWNRPIASRPGAYIDVMERQPQDTYGRDLRLTGNKIHCLNLGSYNYLGFADDHPGCSRDVLTSIEQYGIGSCASRYQGGNFRVHEELEQCVARYVKKPDAMVIGMGFATNSTVLPALISKGTLLISDSLNHASLVTGARGGPPGVAKIKVFHHGNYKQLEHIVREAIVEGQPYTHRPWSKIVILVEGIYSMEGEVVDLQEVVRIKKKYKCYLYLDEAHSIGAIGASGRGACEYAGVNPDDVDILMGTFTKSFGSAGGYIASSKEVIDYLRVHSAGLTYASAMTPATAQQALSALKIMLGEDGTNEGKHRLNQLHNNANYFRQQLRLQGFQVYGSKDSPVIPVMLYNPAKIPAFSRECLKRGLAVVVVGFPATSIIKSRARFCISAAHTKQDLDQALAKISEVGDLLLMKYDKGAFHAEDQEKIVFDGDDQ